MDNFPETRTAGLMLTVPDPNVWDLDDTLDWAIDVDDALQILGLRY